MKVRQCCDNRRNIPLFCDRLYFETFKQIAENLTRVEFIECPDTSLEFISIIYKNSQFLVVSEKCFTNSVGQRLDLDSVYKHPKYDHLLDFLLEYEKKCIYIINTRVGNFVNLFNSSGYDKELVLEVIYEVETMYNFFQEEEIMLFVHCSSCNHLAMFFKNNLYPDYTHTSYNCIKYNTKLCKECFTSDCHNIYDMFANDDYDSGIE